jgi:hypothetical protein
MPPPLRATAIAGLGLVVLALTLAFMRLIGWLWWRASATPVAPGISTPISPSSDQSGQPAPSHVREHIINRTIYLFDYVRGSFIIEHKHFENCKIIGPAVVTPIRGSHIIGCTFDGTPDIFLWEIPKERVGVTGSIGLVDCMFRDCKFVAVGVSGRPEFMERFREALRKPLTES